MSFEIDNNKAPEPFIRENAPKRRKPAPEGEQKPTTSGGGLGCALMGIVLVLVVALIGVALFLPPFSIGDRLFGASYTALNQQAPQTTSGGLTVSVDPANPGTGFGVRLRSVAYEIFVGQTKPLASDTEWLTAARTTLPQTLTLLSPLYVIEKQGIAKNIKVAVTAPQVPDLALADLYRYDAQSKRWQFVPSHPSEDGKLLVADIADSAAIPERLGVFLSSRLVPITGVSVDVGQPLKPGAAEIANVIYPGGLQPAESGALQGVLPADVQLGKGYGVVPVIRNFTNAAAIDVATVTTLLQNSGLRAVHIQRLIDFATSKAYQGLAVDYRRVPADQRDNFTAFITALAQKLHNSNLTLTVVVPLPDEQGTTFDTGAYNWRAIGAVADTVQIVLPLNPQAFAENGLVSSTLRWAVGEVNRARLQIILSALSVQETEGSYSTVGYNEALAPLGQIRLRPVGSVQAGTPLEAILTGYRAQFDPLDTSSTPSIKYFTPDGTLAGTMWLTTGAVLGKRLERISAFNIAGIVLPDMNAAETAEDIAAAVAKYKLNQPIDAPVALSLVWKVNAGGTVLAENPVESGKPFTYTPTGDYESIQISAIISGANVTFGPASIRVTAASTPTATPTPPLSTDATESPADSPTAEPTESAQTNSVTNPVATPTATLSADTSDTTDSQPDEQPEPTDSGEMMG